MVTQVAPDTYALDARMMDTPATMSPYVVDAVEPVVVDPGPAAGIEHVVDDLAAVGVEPAEVAYIVPTHVHLDHAGATGALAEHCPNATVVVHERGVDYLTDAAKRDRLYESARAAVGDQIATGYGRPELVDRRRCRVVSGGETVDCGDRSLELVDAPGHAPHQVAVLDDRTGALFAGDAAGMSLFGELLPTTPAPDFDLELSLETLARLRERDAETLCYGHYGAHDDPDDALGAYTELLPEWVAAVEEAAAAHEDRDAIVAALSKEWSSPTIERDVVGVLQTL
ncbi:MBL fold metallo-hydrolase [Haloarchaeobius iranensis]|uniref:Glyoxylase, beta-lactamase superfamily II n=1 Tax=Haloarchaeobius iranensis TaxID=996166 RepID=A0A1G9UD26_9EURY|nr:MBL fold metallo-hydrolase [Haloarchaeobius iranensis]SDM57465.1 Glyoxylase, beta-lactamase superfamily II [Haloarchaeobius iranensis]